MKCLHLPERFSAHRFLLVRAGRLLILLLAVLGGNRPILFAQAEQPESTAFASLWAADSTLSSAQRITLLQNFVLSHPDYAPASVLLLQSYLLDDRAEEASHFFHDLTGRSAGGIGWWMLARLARWQGWPGRAISLYRLALQAEEPPAELLQDMIGLSRQWPDSLPPEQLLAGVRLSDHSRRLFRALQEIEAFRYREAGAILTELLRESPQEKPLIELLGKCYYRSGAAARADSLWRESRRRAESEGDIYFSAYFIYNRGLLAHARGDYPQAWSRYDSARVLARQMGNFELVQMCLGNQANVAKLQEKYGKALKLYQQAGEIAGPLRLLRYQANWQWGSGESLFFLNRYSEALLIYDRAAELARRSRDTSLLIKIRMSRGDLYYTLRLTDLAEAAFQSAYHTAVQQHLTDEAHEAQVKLADIMVLRRQYQPAIRIYRDFVEQTPYRLYKAYWQRQIAEIYLKQGNLPEARKNYLEALDNSRQANYQLYVGWCQSLLGALELKAGNPQEAREYLYAALTVAQTLADTSLLIAIHVSRGDLEKLSGRLPEALAAYRLAAGMVEKRRADLKVEQFRIGYFSEESAVYTRLIDTYFPLAQQQPELLDSLFLYAEMARGRALKDLTVRGNADDTSENGEQLTLYRQAAEHLREVQRQLRLGPDSASQNVDSLQARLKLLRYSLLAQRLKLIETRRERRSHRAASATRLTDLQKQMSDRQAALLFYHIGDASSFALVVDGRATRLVPLAASRAQLDSLVAALMNPFHRIADDNARQVVFRADLAYRLFQILLEPLKKGIPLPSRLLIVPDLPLMNLPFELLLDEPPAQAEFTPADPPSYARHFVVQRYAISYSPTAAILQREWEDSPGNPRLAVFANPASDVSARNAGWNFPPLPFSEVEGQQIRNIWSGAAVFKQDAASKETFWKAAEEYDILHFATHGFVDTTFDAFSGLALSPGSAPDDDGLLMGYELADLRLHCELTTLSACETGRGKMVAGEGVLGLPRLFLGAGSQSVLMSLWKVDDRFTAEMMPDFYDRVLNRRLSRGDALAEAKRRMLESAEEPGNGVYRQHPVHWAAFTLFGDPGRQAAATTWPYALLAALLAAVIGWWIWKRKGA